MNKLISFLVVLVLSTTMFGFANAKQKVTLLMDWFPQGNQSGYWQAQFDNQYHDDLEIIVKSGGPKVNTTTAVASGQVEFGLQASDSVMLANSKGAGLKGIGGDVTPLHPNTERYRRAFPAAPALQGMVHTLCGRNGNTRTS